MDVGASNTYAVASKKPLRNSLSITGENTHVLALAVINTSEIHLANVLMHTTCLLQVQHGV